MGSAFALPCLDNNHDVNIVGTHLENDFIESFNKNDHFHPGLNTKIPNEIKIFKFDKFKDVLNSNVDLIVLAGWMRIIKNPESFPAPMINVHPSLLPKYKGLHAVEQAMKAGEEYTGCTVHYVNEELDGGEIIIQKEVPILAADDVESLTKAVQRMEYSILPEAIKNVKYKIQTRVN